MYVSKEWREISMHNLFCIKQKITQSKNCHFCDLTHLTWNPKTKYWYNLNSKQKEPKFLLDSQHLTLGFQLKKSAWNHNQGMYIFYLKSSSSSSSASWAFSEVKRNFSFSCCRLGPWKLGSLSKIGRVSSEGKTDSVTRPK